MFTSLHVAHVPPCTCTFYMLILSGTNTVIHLPTHWLMLPFTCLAIYAITHLYHLHALTQLHAYDPLTQLQLQIWGPSCKDTPLTRRGSWISGKEGSYRHAPSSQAHSCSLRLPHTSQFLQEPLSTPLTAANIFPLV